MKNNHLKDRNSSIEFANYILENKKDFVILDTETTGLGSNDVIVQIGIIDMEGNVLLDTLIKPTQRKRISGEATAIHGITMNMLKNCPTFKDIYSSFREIIKNKKVLIYNADYDLRIIVQTSIQDEFVLEDFRAICIMKLYSMFIGEWSDYHNDYKFQKLPSSDHSAIGDCKAALDVIIIMAKNELFEIPRPWWQFWKS